MDKGMLKWFWRGYLQRYWPWMLLALILMIIEGSTLGLLSYMMKPMFDNVFIEGQSDTLLLVGLVFMGLFFARAITSVGQKVIMKWVAEASAAEMRADLLSHLMRLDVAFHQTHPPGTLIERVQGDVGALNTVWQGLLRGLGRDLISVIWLFGVALWVDWRWTLVALVGIPLLVLPSLLVQGYVRRKARDARVVAAAMSTRLDEVFHGINPIKLNSLEPYQEGRYRRLTRQRVHAETRSVLGQAAIPGLIDIMTGIGFFGVLLYGGAEIIAGEKSVGDFMAFFTAMALAFEPLRRLGDLSGMWQAAAAAIERVQELLSTKPTLIVPAKPRTAPQKAPTIRFEDVSLSYGDLPVLKGAAFTAEEGKTTALVGASGAGKSTLFNVLTRLVDPNSGKVTLDGVAIDELALTDLRGMISTVAQEAALFDETLRENVLLGREDVDEDRLMQVLRDAHVADFLPDLSDGLDTHVGPRGSALSGGQRQRVAIARALLRDTPILLLDEATSALDTKSEAIVQSALDRLAKGRTTLVIAHRLSTIQNAHKIVVMDKGRVVDEGTHDELLKRGGLYADLYRLQFKDGMQVVDRSNRAKRADRPATRVARPLGWFARLLQRQED